MRNVSDMTVCQWRMKMKHYVVGFLFNKSMDNVLLIRKNRPEWQKDFWNGVGGKIDPSDKSPVDAMVREFGEETGLRISWPHWRHCITIVCPGGTVYFYGNIWNEDHIPVHQKTDEKLGVFPVSEMPNLRVIENLKWTIPFCLSTAQMPIMVQQSNLGGSE